MSCPEYDSFAEFYDHVLPYRLRDDVAFFVEEARACGGPVLEVACGTGRVLLPVARAGVPIVGLDLSPGMLDVCRLALAQEPAEVRERVTLHEGDMRAFDLGRRFPLVMVPFRGFQHLLTTADQRTALQAIRRHVAGDGRFILDLFNPSIPFLGDERFHTTPIEEPEVSLPDGRRFRRTLQVVARDLFEQLHQVEITHRVTSADGGERVQRERFALRYLFRFEAEHLLEREGFAVEAVYGDYQRHAYGATAYPGDLVFVARPRNSTGTNVSSCNSI
jgi:SAM-dependent methyltransferase